MNRLRTLVSVAALSLAALLAIGAGSAAASFHGQAGQSLTGSPIGKTVLQTPGGGIECEGSILTGVVENANTQEMSPSFYGCSEFGYPLKVNTTGCRFRLDSAREATLHSCANGGIELSVKVTGVAECSMLVPNQTVPVGYENGQEASGQKYLNVALASAIFEAKITLFKKACWWSPSAKTFTIATNYKTTSASGFSWTSGNETTPEFHSAASSSIEAKAAENTKFTVMQGGKPYEEHSCETPSLTGHFAAASHSATLSELSPGAVATGKCKSSAWNEIETLSEVGCKYEVKAGGGIALSGCEGGGLTISMWIKGVARCTLLIPNQSATGVTYKNHGAGGIVGVRGTVNAGLTGEITVSTGLCAYSPNQTVSVYMNGLVDFVPTEAANEIWFG